jgi:hypothetical protein
MLYFFTFLFFVSNVFGAHNPQSVTVGYPNEWNDFEFCDHDEWTFENPDPLVHAVHRNGGEDLIDSCFYGEFSGDSETGNHYGFTYFNLVDDTDTHVTSPVTIIVEARLWAFCDYQNSDRIELWVYDEYNEDIEDIFSDLQLDFENNYDNSQLVYSIGKRDNTCFDANNVLFQWENELTDVAPDWYNEIECHSNNNKVSCYTDISIPVTVSGGVFGILFKTDMNQPITTAAWAYSNINLRFYDNGPDGMCCTGTRNDHPNKSCGAFHEERNCVAKGCNWSEEEQCQITCCRFNDKKRLNKEKPQCKSYNSPPSNVNRNACNNREECDLTVCDVIGMGDNTDGL